MDINLADIGLGTINKAIFDSPKPFTMKKRLLLTFRVFTLIMILAAANTLKAQQYLGFANSNYSGVHGTLLQPASIVDNRMKFDLNLVSFQGTFWNNYVSIRAKEIRKNYDSDLDFQDTYLNIKENSNNKYVYANVDILGPSFQFNIGRKNALGFSSRMRTTVNLDNVTPELARLSWEGLDYPELWGLNLNNERLSAQMMSWVEYGATYGREVFEINDRHYLKAAVTVKLLQGLGAAYLFVDDLDYNFTNDDTLSLFNSDVKYGHSTNFDFDDVDNIQYEFISDPTVGLDLGFVYEWRKDKEEYTYDMDGETGLYRKDKNKYKLKVGLSILDIGRVRFQKGDISANFLADINDYYIGDFELGSVEDFNDTLEKNFNFTQTSGEYFTMKLPTSMSLQVDYNIWRGFYANFTAFGSFRRNNAESKLRQQSTFSIAPRYEHKWFDLAVPIIFNTDGMFMLGSSIRLGVLFVGTNNVLSFARNDVYGADVYAGIKVPIPYGKPKDRDKDKVSNRKDNCPKEPGLWEFAGCPDTDLDGLPDDQDECPKEFGPKDNKGCPYPDLDGDGIVNAEDGCPNEFGPKENKGCPWGDKDGDGLTDNVDNCPDVAGPRENVGCPWGDRDKDTVLDNVDNCPDEAGAVENKGCPWGDFDGDGVKDNVDECPRTPGPADNNGCPKLQREQAEIVERAFDNLQFETGKAVIKQSSYATLTDLAKLLIDNPTYTLIIAGHTDNVGADDMNMKLSKERAEAVVKAMTDRGVKPEQFIVEYYGETKPIATNATAAGRTTNRRVEMTIKFQ